MTHPVDMHVGARIVAIRLAKGLNQSDLARHLGLSFQQVQKYEKGSNRISASKLWELSVLLAVPISAFFEGLASDDGEPVVLEAPADTNTASTREMARLVPTLPVDRQRLALDLVRMLAEP